MNIIALATMGFLAMLNPDGSPMGLGNAAIDPGVLAAHELAVGRIFETNISFTGTILVSVNAPAAKEFNVEMEARCAFRGRWERYELEADKIKSNEDPKEVALMKRLKRDEEIHVFQPDKNVSFVIYSKLKAWYLDKQLQGLAVGEELPPKIERTKVGEETVLGHKCVKYKVVVTDQTGGKFSFHGTRWEALDLNNFPIKNVLEEEGMTVTTIFKDVKLVDPPASLFEPPAEYKKWSYEELRKYMQEEVAQPVRKQVS